MPPAPPPPPLVRITRDALASLLKEAGRPETPEEFLNQQHLRTVIEKGERFQGRARAAYWSRLWLAASTLFSFASMVSSRSWEDVISVVLLGGMTVVEFRVHKWFQEGDERAPIWGWWNQCLFSALFLLYGGYHLVTANMPPEVVSTFGESMGLLYLYMSRIVYFAVGIGGGVGQFVLAVYYRKSLPPPAKGAA